MGADICELRELVLQEVYDGLWHTTHLARFTRILGDGAILPEPNIPESERWGMSYVRSLGGVSLFEFKGFEPVSYSKEFPLSSWAEFVPFRSVWNSSVWIEIDRERVLQKLVSGFNLLEQWKAGKVYKRLMPHIEAAHLGPVSKNAFKRAFFVCRDSKKITELL